MEPADLERLPALFPLEEFYCPPPEILRKEVQRPRGQFNIIHHDSGSKADLYPRKSDPLDLWAFQNRRPFQVAGETVVVAPPEYIIVGKLEFFRQGGSEKHLRDIQAMLAVSSDMIRFPELERMITEKGLAEAWQQAKNAPE